MSSIAHSFQKRRLMPLSDSLPVSQPEADNGGLRRRLASLSLMLQQPISSSSSAAAASWAFRRSKSVSAMGETAGSSVKEWWDWGWSWILSRKPVFARDLEMNKEEASTLGSRNRGSWRHVFYRVRSEIRKLLRSNNVGLPQTCRHHPVDYGKNLDPSRGVPTLLG